MLTAPDGAQYAAAAEIQHLDGYADITPDLLRTWAHAGDLDPVTAGELAAAFGRPLPAGVDPDDVARLPGPNGGNIYRWADVVATETRKRRARTGRPRRNHAHLPPAPAFGR